MTLKKEWMILLKIMEKRMNKMKKFKNKKREKKKVKMMKIGPKDIERL